MIILVSFSDKLFFTCCFQDFFFFSLVFNSLTMMWISVGLLEFFLLGVCWASWVCRLMFFLPDLRSSLQLHLQTYIFCPLSLFFWGPLFTCVGILDVNLVSEALLVFFIAFLPLQIDYFSVDFFLQVHWFFFQLDFSFQVCIFQLRVSIWFFHIICISIYILCALHRFHHSFH